MQVLVLQWQQHSKQNYLHRDRRAVWNGARGDLEDISFGQPNTSNDCSLIRNFSKSTKLSVFTMSASRNSEHVFNNYIGYIIKVLLYLKN